MVYHMAAPHDRYLMCAPVEPIVEKINSKEEQYDGEIIVWYPAGERRVIVNDHIYAKSQELQEYACDLWAYAAAEIGDGVIEPVIRQMPHTRDEEFYPDE